MHDTRLYKLVVESATRAAKKTPLIASNDQL